jgi:hypothetical protein
MRGTSLLRPLAVTALTIAAAACNTRTVYPTPVLRPAEGAPPHFVRADGSPMLGPSGVAVSCPSPIMDPNTHAQLTMVRSYAGRADYAVPQGSYGAGAGELLRVDCGDGSAAGIVKG